MKFLAVVGAITLLVIACACGGLVLMGRLSEDIARLPRITAEGINITYDCTSIFDVCARVTCLIRNSGGSTGTETVVFTYSSTNGKTWTQEQLVTLDPATQFYYSADFDGAELTEAGAGRCDIKRR